MLSPDEQVRLHLALKQTAQVCNVPEYYADEFFQILKVQHFAPGGQPIRNLGGMFRRWLEKFKRVQVAKGTLQRAEQLARGTLQVGYQVRTRTDWDGRTFERAEAQTNAPTQASELVSRLLKQIESESDNAK